MLRRKVTIHVSPGARLEAPPPGIKQVFKPCQQYVSFRKEDLARTDYYKIEKTQYHPLIEKLCHMFRLHEVQNMPIVTQLLDSIATRGCHARDDPLPCYNGRCLDYVFANKLFDFSHWAFSHAFTEHSSMVGLMPFLRHSLLGLMEAVTKGEREAKRFILSLAHDAMMTQLLLALGIQLDNWMPYASRITFELWRSKATSLNAGKFFVRVLFNGSPITQQLAAWQDSHTVSDFLPYHMLKRYLETGRYRDTKSYNHVCFNFNS
jgi:hypothetical protein